MSAPNLAAMDRCRPCGRWYNPRTREATCPHGVLADPWTPRAADDRYAAPPVQVTPTGQVPIPPHSLVADVPVGTELADPRTLADGYARHKHRDPVRWYVPALPGREASDGDRGHLSGMTDPDRPCGRYAMLPPGSRALRGARPGHARECALGSSHRESCRDALGALL